MDHDLFDFSIQKKPSTEFPDLDNFEETKMTPTNHFGNSSPLGSQEIRRKSKKLELGTHKLTVNLSINVNKSKNKEENRMLQSMMPSLHHKKFSERMSIFTPSTITEKAETDGKKRNRIGTRTRHNSLTYSKRDKYISSFDGKSHFLSKLIRPSESNDSRLIFLEENYGKLDTDDYCPPSAKLKGFQNNNEPKINNYKSKPSAFKKSEKSGLFFGNRKTSIDKRFEDEEEFKDEKSSDSENNSHTKLENHVFYIDSFFHLKLGHPKCAIRRNGKESL